MIFICTELYLVFDLVALWSSHSLVSTYFTDPKMESSRIGGIHHGYSSRSVSIRKLELEWS